MQVVEVTNKIIENEFIQFPKSLYKDDLEWIAPLDEDIKSVFNAKTNNYFLSGDAIRWIVKRNNTIVGRIAAFYKKEGDQMKGGIGFLNVFMIKVLLMLCLIQPKSGYNLNIATLWKGQSTLVKKISTGD
jgi:hypothetical protein